MGIPAKHRLPIWAALLTLLLTPLAGAADLDAVAARFDHPDRYRHLFERLQARGVAPGRIEEVFTSEKAARRDPEAVRLRTDIREIPKHKQAERKANQRYLYEAKVLAEHLEEHAATYDRMETEYGIRREIVGAILLKESALGRYDSFGHDAFVVFNSLLDGLELPEDAGPRLERRIPRLLQLAREQLIALVLYAERRGVNLSRTPLPASYAGALGIPQWLPTHLDFAVAAGEGPPDLSRVPDAILSTANLIRNKFGWPEEMVNLQRLDNLGEIVAAWQEFDKGNASFAHSRNADGQPVRRFDRARSDLPNIGYVGRYVRALMRYNFSSDYALGVLQIAHRTHRMRRDAD
jgi:membrane-bound lytic murein transglycosylase B